MFVVQNTVCLVTFPICRPARLNMSVVIAQDVQLVFHCHFYWQY